MLLHGTGLGRHPGVKWTVEYPMCPFHVKASFLLSGAMWGLIVKWLFMPTHEMDHLAQVTSCFRPWRLLSQDYETLLPSPWDTTHLQLSQHYKTTLP